MTSNLRITPDDWRDATLSCSVTPPTGFEVQNTQNAIRSDVLRTSGLTTFTITATWTASRTFSAFYVFNHLLHGANVRLQVGSYDSTALPALCYSLTDDDYTFSTGTKDPNKADSPYWLYFPETSASSATVTISGTPSAVSVFQLGTIVLGRYFEAERDPPFGDAELDEEDTGRSTRTEGASKRGYPGSSWPKLVFGLHYIPAEQRAFWRDFMRQVKRTTYFGISLYPGEGGSLERDHTICGTFANLDALNHEVKRFTKKVQIEGA
jgi:hypothetical protein